MKIIIEIENQDLADIKSKALDLLKQRGTHLDVGLNVMASALQWFEAQIRSQGTAADDDGEQSEAAHECPAHGVSYYGEPGSCPLCTELMKTPAP